MEKTALVFDDEPTARLMATVGLTTLGYSVISCGERAEALRCLDERHFDVVVSDLCAPSHTDGGAVIARAIATQMPTVILASRNFLRNEESGEVEIVGLDREICEDIRRFESAGVILMPKPFNLADARKTLGLSNDSG